jgi:hypothetical protein
VTAVRDPYNDARVAGAKDVVWLDGLPRLAGTWVSACLDVALIKQMGEYETLIFQNRLFEMI